MVVVVFPRVVAHLEERLQPGDVIIHDNKLTFFPAYYFNRDLPQKFLADPELSSSDTLAAQTQETPGLMASSLEAAVGGKS